MGSDRQPVLISADWGTTALRVYLLSNDGTIVERRVSQQGLTSIAKHEFAEVLHHECRDWLARYGALPALLSGMVGSRQGWVEAPYVSCPAGLAELASHRVDLEVPGFRSVGIVAGMDAIDATGVPDVMRGEECQIMGALTQLRLDGGTFVLPGTHSKWATVSSGKIATFQTFMTGEVFAALKDHTILGRMMTAAARSSGGAAGRGFERGVHAAGDASSTGAWLHRLFSVRTLGLMGKLPDDEAADYLSGLLIGWEMAGASRTPGEALVLVGAPELTSRYRMAAAILGLATVDAPEDCVCVGHIAIARAASIVSSPRA